MNSNIKYTANGYLPCNGYVPCQPAQFSPQQVFTVKRTWNPNKTYNTCQACLRYVLKMNIPGKYWKYYLFFNPTAGRNMIIDHQLFLQLEKRVADAEPCHNYRDNGDGPEGCWWCRNFEIYVSINNLRVITINSPTTRLDKSKDSTSARIPYNQLPSWHNECFN